MRICFAGTPVFAAAHLQALLKAGHHVTAVYTQPDRPAGRGKKLQASPVKQIALENELLVFQPASLRPVEEVELLSSLNIDLMIVVAYGLILPQSILDILPKRARIIAASLARGCADRTRTFSRRQRVGCHYYANG